MLRILLVFSIVRLGALSPIADSPKDSFMALMKETSGLAESYAKTRNVTALDRKIIQTDRRLASMTVKLLTRSASVDKIKGESKGCLVWREFPHNLTKDVRISFQLNDTRDPIINFRRYLMHDGAILLFCENSFWTPRRYSGRINPSLYVVHIKDGRATLSCFKEPFTGSPTIRFLSSSPGFLGIIPEPGGGFPKVVLLYGPSGSGRFADLHVFSYNSKRNLWSPKRILQLSGLEDYHYSESDHVLHYTVKNGTDWAYSLSTRNHCRVARIPSN